MSELVMFRVELRAMRRCFATLHVKAENVNEAEKEAVSRAKARFFNDWVSGEEVEDVEAYEVSEE